MKKTLIALLLLACGHTAIMASDGDDKDVKAAMKRATQYMMDVVACNGGFVWNYLPDFSRQWGELEATRTMVWVQSPGTPDMGQLFLDAYHATGDEYYYDCAKQVALCLAHGQLECGGWNYMFDLAPKDSIRQWYATVGRQAWRLEEFQHYYGNATFDDKATQHCAEFMLRIYLEKHENEFLTPLSKAIGLILESQYPNGGWPQRYPLMDTHPFRGQADYTPFVTLNDDATPENIKFLLQCYTSMGMVALREPILRGMHCLRDLQQPTPLAGWADQYTPDDLKPAHARSYEPRSINTGTTSNMIRLMIEYYKMTGDKSFLKGIPDAITFLENQQLPRELAQKVRRTPLQDGEILIPRFIDPDTGRPIYVHRRGGNVGNGEYYTDGNTDGTIAHYSSFHVVNPKQLREMLAEAQQLQQKDLERNSPLNTAQTSGPQEYYYGNWSRYPGFRQPSTSEIVASLNEEGYWPAVLSQVSNPYKPIPKNMATSSDDRSYEQTMAGDEYDTSPYENQAIKGISTRTYIRNMSVLINSLKPQVTTHSGLNPERFESTVAGKKTLLLTMTNGKMEACVTNYGARLVSLMVPDKEGKEGDVVLGFDNIEDYHQQKQNFGSIVGRYAGRIKSARFTLDGQDYQLQNNGHGGNISHGGYPGFSDQVWDVVSANDSIVRLKYVSPDGENGFPGTLSVQVTYHLSSDMSLNISYEATTDKPTVVNLTNHAFFNISADPTQNVLNQKLYVDSKYIATYDSQKNVDGKFMRVKNTPFDFTTLKDIGTDIDIYDEQMSITRGYDHAFALRHAGKASVPAAMVYDENSGRVLTVYTTEPAIQIYTANGLSGNLKGKNGIAYQKQSAICLETMHFSDSPNHSEFPSTVLRPGETYRSRTTYQFSDKPSHRDRNLVQSILLYSGAASLTGLGIIGIVSLAK